MSNTMLRQQVRQDIPEPTQYHRILTMEINKNKYHRESVTQFGETTPTSGGLSPQPKKGNSLLAA